MKWNDHNNLIGTHAFLSPSQCGWLKDDEEKVISRYYNSYLAARRGDAMHALAADLIREGIKLNQSDKHLITYGLRTKGFNERIDTEEALMTLLPYVNDAIGFRMSPEVLLYYTDAAYGCTDAIAFDEHSMFLRIHDLKTGVSPVHIEQLLCYAALFCLEYDFKPRDLRYELRIYQKGDVTIHQPEISEVAYVCDRYIIDNKILLKERR